MGRKLAGVFGIVAAVLAFGFGTSVEAGPLNHTAGHHVVVADGQNPTCVAPADGQNPTCTTS
jgi:hypothetical protein